MNSVPLVTTVSPTARPLRTSTSPLIVSPTVMSLFFFNDPATTEIYTRALAPS